MRYVQARNGVFERYVTDIEPTQWDENNYCFARNLSPERAAMLGVHKLKIVTPPYFDIATQKRVEKDAVLIDGQWTQVYVVETMTAEETENRYNEWANKARALRAVWLAETDWMALSDNTMTPEWASYRQALRDITSQGGFPYTIEWPTKPGE